MQAKKNIEIYHYHLTVAIKPTIISKPVSHGGLSYREWLWSPWPREPEGSSLLTAIV